MISCIILHFFSFVNKILFIPTYFVRRKAIFFEKYGKRGVEKRKIGKNRKETLSALAFLSKKC